MRPTSPVRLLNASLLVFGLHVVGPGAALAENVGTAGAVNVRSTGMPPGEATRTIEIGSQVVRNEKIDTSATGSVQVVFVDKTSLNVGPNSTLVIDDFAYRPAESSGKLALSLGRGLLRVVGGQATHTGGASVTTAVATIGIRGGIATIEFCPTPTPTCVRPGLRATNHFGQITVTALDGSTQTVTRAGFTVVVTAAGQMAGAPFREALTQVDADNARLTSRQGQNGGSRIIPVDTTGQRNGLGATNASLNPAVSTSRQTQSATTAQARSGINVNAEISASEQTLIQTAVAQSAAITTAADIQQAMPPVALPPGPSLLPNVGSATYSGTIVASIANNGARYVSTGLFSDIVNFATGKGAVSVGNLDGANYAGMVAPTTANRTTFSGTLAGGTSGSMPSVRSLTLNGRFAAYAGSPYGQINGSATLRGANYLGGGTFVAH